MRPAETSRAGFPRGWWPLLFVALVYAGVIATAVALRTSGVAELEDYEQVRERTTSDFRDFWWTARHLRMTGGISTDFGVHNYLPFFTVFMLPWSFLPLPVAAVGFSLLSLGLTIMMLLLAENLLADGLPARPRGVFLLAVALMLPYAHACLVVGNLGLLLAFLLVATWFLVERGREWEAGVALGLAALIKLLPALVIVYFVLKRRWRVVFTAIGVTVVLGIALPLAAIGPQATWTQHVAFFERAVSGHSAYRTIMTEKPIKAKYSNNALPIVLRRLMSPVNARPGDDARAVYVNLVDAPQGLIVATYGVLIAVIVGTTLAGSLRGSRQWPPRSIAAGRALRGQYGVWTCLTLLAAPLLWTHYLPLAYWGLAVLADQAERDRRARRRGWWLVAAALAGWLGGVVALAFPSARAAGAQLASVLLLWLVLLRTGWYRPPGPPQPAEQPDKSAAESGNRGPQA